MTNIFTLRDTRPITHWENQAGPFTIERPTYIAQSNYSKEIKFYGFDSNPRHVMGTDFDVALWRIKYKSC